MEQREKQILKLQCVFSCMHAKFYSISSHLRYAFDLGGSEVLMAHGLPLASWAASEMGTPTFNAAGISTRSLSEMAGNSLHIVSETCLCYLHGDC